MIDDLTITERQVADLKAAEYIGKGYNVAREVSLEFLPGYRVDLVVEKDGECKVIEVTSRSSLRAMPALRELERVINSQPGWSFELQIIGEPERLTLPERSSWLDSAGVRARLEQSEKLDAEGFPEAALLIAWTATEAVARMLVADQGVAIDRATDSGYILGIAVAYGAIAREDYRALVRILAHRNAVAHGFEVPDSTTQVVSDTIGIVKRLLRERGGPPGPSCAHW